MKYGTHFAIIRVMRKLSLSDRVRIVSCLTEGNSLRSTARITGFHRTTIMKLLSELGTACAAYQYKAFRNLPCKRIQCDEIWSFVGCKERRLTDKQRGKGRGDVWTWTAICADTKLVPVWHVGNRDLDAAYRFIHDLKSRINHRIELTTDAYKPYLMAVEDAFGSEIDFATLIKVYSRPMRKRSESRYSPAQCTEVKVVRVCGNPNLRKASTSLVERQNLTMRMSMRRFTRLTNAFSKKIDNLKHSVALHFMCYNFVKIHGSLRMTPAMAAGISDHVWSLEEVIGLIG